MDTVLRRDSEAAESRVRKHEENGVVFFDEPYIKRPGIFGFDHIGSDYIFVNRDYEDDTECVVAYASSPEYNYELHKVRDRNFPEYFIQQHVGEWMINGI